MLPRNASLAVVIFTAAVIGIGSAMLTPLISLRVEAAGYSTAWNGALAAVPSLAVLIAGPGYPGVVARFGMVTAFFASTAVGAVSIVLFPFTDNYWLWVALRLTAGMALGLQWVVSEAWINGLADNKRRGMILGLFVSMMSAGLALGPLLLSFVGSAGYLPFMLCALAYSVCSLPLPLAERPAAAPDGHVALNLASVATRAPREMLAGAVNGLSWMTALSLLPLYLLHLGTDASTALRYITAMCIGSLVAQPFLGRVIDVVGVRTMLVLCGAGQVAICLVLAFTAQSPLLGWPVFCLWGALTGATYTAGITGMGNRFPASDMAAASTGFTMTWELGALAGPFIAGFAMRGFDPHGMTVMLGIAGTALALLSLRRVRAAVPEPQG